ncbi:MAG: hypothetical protein IJW19_04105 [Clostridia bacterium]|nr:hypothetical protein [Clostridia bacterium]
MINYPEVTHGNQFAIGPFAINSSGDFLILISASAHLGLGGHVSAGFNVSEFIERLFD